MFCENCGKEVLENEKFCSNCGYKIITEIEEANNNNQNVAKPLKKKKIKWIIGIVITVIIICIAFSVAGGEPEEYEFEADELAEILNNGEADQYYGKELHVHGLFYRHPDDVRLYMLYGENTEAQEVLFTNKYVDEELGDGSEVIVTGFLGTSENWPSFTILTDAEIEVVKKAERIYSVGTVDELLDESDKYIGKKISVVGSVEGIGDSVWLRCYYTENNTQIRLAGDILNISYDSVENWNDALVTGVLNWDGDGEVVLEVESVE